MKTERPLRIFHCVLQIIDAFICIASLVAQTVKRPPAMQETQVRSPGREDPLEKEAHSSTLA